MADDSTTPAGQAPASGQAPQETGQTPIAGQAPETDAFEPERARALIAKLREQERTQQKELSELRNRVKAADDAKLSEQERLTQRLAELERQQADATRSHQERILRYEAQLAANKLHIVDPDAAVKLMDWSTLEYDDAGQPTNIETVLKDLLKTRPYLAAQAAAPQASPTNPARTQTAAGSRTYTVEQLRDHAFYTAHREDIQAAMREGRIVRE